MGSWKLYLEMDDFFVPPIQWDITSHTFIFLGSEHLHCYIPIHLLFYLRKYPTNIHKHLYSTFVFLGVIQCLVESSAIVCWFHPAMCPVGHVDTSKHCSTIPADLPSRVFFLWKIQISMAIVI